MGKLLELEGVRKDGNRFPVELSVAPVRLRGDWGAVGIVRDVTERKRVEASSGRARACSGGSRRA